MDGEGVSIDVEEAVLEVSSCIPAEVSIIADNQANDDNDVDGIMVYYPIYGARQVNSGLRLFGCHE